MKKENLDKIISLRHELHRHPDLSLKEKETKDRLIAFIRQNTSLLIEDRGSWFYACNKEGKNGLAFRADMDALPIEEGREFPYHSQNPGISHKCGHDGHMAALCGLALELEQAEFEKPIYLIFQPAEEIGKGAVLSSALIQEKDIREIYAFHNLGGFPEKSIVYRRGLSQPASEGLTLSLFGKASHASAPEKGIHPAPAIAELITFANTLGNENPSESMRLCTIVNVRIGTKDFGISPGEGEISFTLRAEEESRMQEMETALLEKAEELAKTSGLRLQYERKDYFPETRNHETGIQRILQAAKELGKECIEMKDLWRASEDFGYYTKKCRGAIFYIGTGENRPALHTPEYDFNDAILETAADLFFQICLSSEFPDLSFK